ARASANDDAVDRSVAEAMAEGHFTFCTDPGKPLGLRQRRVCPLAKHAENCEGLVAACNTSVTPANRDWYERIAKWLAPVATFFRYPLVLATRIAIAVPIVRSIRNRQRDKQKRAEPEAKENRAVVQLAAPEPPPPTDAEAMLRLADEHRARGELDRAL